MKKDLVIALDGPSGSGKSTVAQKVAQNLGLIYIDTGAMFRALAYAFKDLDIPFELPKLNDQDEEKIVHFLQHHNFQYAPSAQKLMTLDGEDLTEKIRYHEISQKASILSKHQVVRDFIKDWQQRIVHDRQAILDGRDIGTVIFPQALLKIFLTASPKERAQRRFEELKKRGQDQLEFDTVLADIEQRDFEDIHRELAPLKKASDSIEIDTSGKSVALIVQEITTLWQERISKYSSSQALINSSSDSHSKE